MSEYNFEISDKIKLPPLIFGKLKRSIGYVQIELVSSYETVITSITEVQVSPRKKEKMYELSDGQRVLITDRKIDMPSGVDGILCKGDIGLKWRAHKLLKECAEQISTRGLPTIAQEIEQSWRGQFQYNAEKVNEQGEVLLRGLRPPQIGGLHSIGSHWSLSKQAATVVMPTGTGKTETMLSTMIAYQPGKILVVVPSQVLRDQTVRKFTNLGLLRLLGNIPQSIHNPIVGVIESRPTKESDLDILKDCNVIISTMSAVADEATSALLPQIADIIDTLIVDEAHHVAASSWSQFREAFSLNKVLQFTATPYRRDGKLVDGKVIYEYPLHMAQKDGYFKKISFKAIFQIDQIEADKAIAAEVISTLRKDIEGGLDHIAMARTSSIDRAKEIVQYYEELAPEYKPIIVHSEAGNVQSELEKLLSRSSRVVVCVNMLGEGFDLPQLKIAGLHDAHKSLAILLQFTGRFTRSSASAIGDATVVANTADPVVLPALERLYSEDADWNQLLSEFSSEAAKAHLSLINFLNTSQRIDEVADNDEQELSHHLFRPNPTTVVYEIDEFSPKKFHEGLSSSINIKGVWLHENRTLYFVTRVDPTIRWTRSKNIRDRVWDLFILHYDETRKLLYVCSSDTSSTFENIAEAVGGKKLISGDIIFRALGRINRLVFQNVGVKKHGRRNLRYAMYTGADVVEALSISERAGSVKSNLSGTGWEHGEPMTIGCSYKGRVWARDPGTIPELIKWCENVGAKLRDDTIVTNDIIKNVLIPEEITALPDKPILGIDWPIELLKQAEERVILSNGTNEISLLSLDIEISGIDQASNRVEFILKNKTGTWATFALTVGGDNGFTISQISPATPVSITVGRIQVPIVSYFSDYPPMIRFIDLSELDGNLLIRPQSVQSLIIPEERFEPWDWTGIDIRKESILKDGLVRQDSIQWKAAQHFIAGNFDVVFNDDDAGEAADLVCLKEENDYIRLVLVHCKFTTNTTSGLRIKDVVEVSAQAIRSAKWKWKFKELCRHILERERGFTASGNNTRFLLGQSTDLNKIARMSRVKELRPEILIVQPGLSQSRITDEQKVVLAAAYSFLKETIGVDLDVICSV